MTRIVAPGRLTRQLLQSQLASIRHVAGEASWCVGVPRSVLSGYGVPQWY